MKKILAAILAAAMTLSLGITAFAAAATPATKATVESIQVKGSPAAGANIAAKAATLKIDGIGEFVSTAEIAASGMSATTVATGFNGAKLQVGAVTFKITATTDTLAIAADTEGAAGTTNAAAGFEFTGFTTAPTPGTVAVVAGKDAVAATGYEIGKYLLDEVILCDKNDAAVAMVEGAGDLNAVDGAKSGTTLYYLVDTVKFPEENFDFSVSKADSAKNVAKVSIVDKNFSSKLIAVGSADPAFKRGTAVTGTDKRNTFVQVELKENFTDAEYKVSFDLKAKCTKAIDAFEKGGYYKFESTGKTWVANTVLDADQDFVNGTSGIVLKPQKNEDNEITWEDENDTVARLTFVGDSNVAKFYPKLSTKWDNADYAELFADQNAFYFDFVGNMGNQTQISSTSRATLEIYNPYYDKETDELTVDPTEIVIYQVATDGSFTDVSDQFTVGENDDGDSVYTTKTRELGTYIFAEKVLAAVEEEVVEAPAKDIPNTGR